MNTDERISLESIQHVVKKFQKVGFEGLKLEDLAIAVSIPEFKDQFMRQTGLDWLHKYEHKALERLRKAHFDMQWMNSQIKEEFTAFFVFIQKGDLAKTKEFLKNYNDMDLAKQAVDSFNRSPLHVACKEGHTSIVEYLLLQGFSVFARDKALKTPLHYAAYHGQEYICEQLVKKGAFIDSTDTKGRTAFHYACCGNSAKIVVLFIGVCPEILEASDINELTGLHYSILNSSLKQIDIVRTLIEFGAKVNCRDKEGKTPLYYASEAGRTRVIPILMQKGADITLSNYENHKTPLDVAVNDHTRELLIVYSSAQSGITTAKKEDVQWMNDAIKGQGLSVVEVPFKEKGASDTNATTQAKKQKKMNKLKEEQGTIQGWARERFFDMMKKVQDEGVKVNQHLKKPFVYTGSWMENITNVEDLYNLLSNLTATEACLCTFNILCPYDKPLPKEDDKEVIDNFYGDAWQVSIKKPMEDRLKKELETQEKLSKLEDIEMKLDYKDKILKDKIEELKKLRQENMDLKVKVQEIEGVSKQNAQGRLNSDQVEELEQDLSKLRQELKEKSRQLVEKDMELELARMEGGGQGGMGKSTLDQDGQEQMRELIKLREEVRSLKIEQKMQRFKTGEIFLKALNDSKRIKGKKEVDSMNVENLQDDEAIINMYMALRNNPPNFIQRLKEVDKDGDNKLTQPEFVKFCSELSLSSQDIVSLQRIVGFFDGKQLLGIAEFKTILENRPKQRQIWEEKLFKKILDAINHRKLSLDKFFDLIDTDGSGEISPQELREGFENLKIVLNQRDFNSIFCIFDKDKSGQISLAEIKACLDNYLDKSQIANEEDNQEQEEGDEEGQRNTSVQNPEKNPICREENKIFLEEENDVDNDQDEISGSLKLQLPTLRNIDPKHRNIYLRITLQGSVENQILHSTQIYTSFIKVAQKFRIKSTTSVNLSRFIGIKIYSNQQMDEEGYLGEIYFAWKGCLRDPNQWHCNQEFTLLNLSYPQKKIQGFLAVQARFIPQLLQDVQKDRPDTGGFVQEIEDNEERNNNNQGNKQIMDFQKEYVEQQKKYMELQKQYMKQQEDFMKLQKQIQSTKPPLLVNKVQSKSQIAAGATTTQQQSSQKQIKKVTKPSQNRIESGGAADVDLNDISSNIDDLLAESDLMNSMALQRVDSDVEFLKNNSKFNIKSRSQSGIQAQDTSSQKINKSILSQIDKNFDYDISPLKQQKQPNKQYSKNFNKDLDNLIHSMNSDIDQLLNNSEAGFYNQEQLELMDSNIDISQLEDFKK